MYYVWFRYLTTLDIYLFNMAVKMLFDIVRIVYTVSPQKHQTISLIDTIRTNRISSNKGLAVSIVTSIFTIGPIIAFLYTNTSHSPRLYNNTYFGSFSWDISILEAVPGPNLVID